jgi:flagellar M-ring protein FliF
MRSREEYGDGLTASIRYYADHVVEAFNSLDRKRKLLLIVGGASLIVIITIILVFTSTPRYTPLYTDIKTQDAASITAYLAERKIPYKLADEGSTILVPDSQKYQLRLDLANNNLPNGNIVGFESFNQTRFGETESEQKIRYVVALQGELERTIGRIDGVEDVRVHIVQPQPALFVQDEKQATASVLIKLKQGHTLEGPQVLGITRLVSSGVEGLKPENVSIIDTNGNILSDDLSSLNQGQLTSNQIKAKQEYEKQLETSVQSMLERVVGPGKAVVRASASLNFDQVEINTQNYGDRQVRNSHTLEESSTTGAVPSEAVGTDGNIPLYPEVEAGGGQTQKTERTTNYEIDTTTERRVIAPGQLEQLSVSVVVDGQMDALQQKQIEDMVASAAGILPDRGDKLTVASMPFNNEAANRLLQEMDAAQRRQTYITVSVILLALMIVIAALVLRYVRNRPQPQLAAEVFVDGVTVEDMLVTGQQQVEISEEKGNETRRLLEMLRSMAKEKPAETVEALRSWLTGE